MESENANVDTKGVTTWLVALAVVVFVFGVQAKFVLGFVLERAAFYSPFVFKPDFVKNARFPLVKSLFFETKRNALKATISES